jgi:hypothetical protein
MPKKNTKTRVMKPTTMKELQCLAVARMNLKGLKRLWESRTDFSGSVAVACYPDAVHCISFLIREYEHLGDIVDTILDALEEKKYIVL